MNRLFLRIFSAFLAVCTFFSLCLFSYSDANIIWATDDIVVIAEQPELNRNDDLPDFVAPEYVPMFTFPTEMRAVYITPTVDFNVANEEGTPFTEDEIYAEVNSMLDSIESNKMNTIIINSEYNGDVFYNTNTNETVEKSMAEYVVKSAKDRNFFVYFNFGLNTALSAFAGSSLQERIDLLALHIHKFTVKYPVDGIILDGYYSSKNAGSIADYSENGSGIGFENWLSDNGAYVYSLAVDSIRKTSNSVSVGISINDVWANYETNEHGSDTSVDFEALNDGYADTVSYLGKGYADFIMLKADGARNSSEKPFGEITRWWNGYADAVNIPLFVRHTNEYICSDEEGWKSPDELVKQVVELEQLSKYSGSAFNSLSALENDKMESTSVLMKHYNDTIDIAGLETELEMTLPNDTKFTTEEPYVIFAGSFDPNFPIYFQGSEVVLNEAGRFYYRIPLEVGVNKLKLQSKAKIIYYEITRTVTVLKDVSPSEDTMRVEEESTIPLSVIAYKDSDVYAEINGKRVDLTPVDGQVDEIDPNSSYTKYVANYTVPKGKKGQDIDLGAITFYGSYKTKTNTFDESIVGSNVIINAVEIIPNDYSGSILKVKYDNTRTYLYKGTDSTMTPDMARLPAGTLDYCVKTVTSGGGTKFYLTNSGKRVKASDVTILDNRPLGENPISVAEVYKAGTDTVIKFGLNEKIPFEFDFIGQNYTSGANGNYYVDDFTATGLAITFDYVTSISASDIVFPESSLFTTGTWSTYEVGETTKTKLTLKFRQAGMFAGSTATYDDYGYLTFTFNGRRNSIDGSVIVIDPGHGYTGDGVFDPGAVGEVKEQTVNLAISKYLTQYLTDRGANVVRYKTESKDYVAVDRAEMAIQYNPDIYISVHANAAGASASGAEAFYFTPYSQPLADLVSEEVGTYTQNQVGTKGDRGELYNVFWATLEQEFPSILVETGFVTNYNEAMALASDKHQRNIASAIIRGIERYFGQCNYSSYGDGVGSFTSSGNLPPMETPRNDETDNPFVNVPDDTITDDQTGNLMDDAYNENGIPKEWLEMFGFI